MDGAAGGTVAWNTLLLDRSFQLNYLFIPAPKEWVLNSSCRNCSARMDRFHCVLLGVDGVLLWCAQNKGALGLVAIISVISYLTCNCSALPYFFSMLFFKCRWLSTSVFFLLLLLLFLFSFCYFFVAPNWTTLECRNNQINCPDSPALVLVRVKMSEQWTLWGKNSTGDV